MSDSQGQGQTRVEWARVIFTVAGAIIFGVIPLFVLAALSLYLFGWNTALANYVDFDVIKNHWPAIFAFPLLAFFSLFLVFLTRIVSGEIKFKLAGSEVSGAASEGLMWIFVFLSLIWGFSELWKLPAAALGTSDKSAASLTEGLAPGKAPAPATEK